MKKILVGLVAAVVVIAAGVLVFVKSPAGPDQMAKATATEQQKAPALPITFYADGKQTDLTKLIGKKPIYLNFWATWCPPCVREMPFMNELYPQYKDKLEFAVVSVDSKKADLDAFMKKTGYDLPIYTTDNAAAGKAFGIQGIPTSILISPSGKIAKVHVGSMSKAEMEAFFKEGAALK